MEEGKRLTAGTKWESQNEIGIRGMQGRGEPARGFAAALPV